MKNLLILLVSIIALSTSSCSKEDMTVEIPITSKPVLLKKIITTNAVNGNFNTIISYNGIKVLEINYQPIDKEVYTYTGEVITKFEELENGVLSTTTYEYLNDKLKTLIYFKTGSQTKTKKTYTHNNDNTVNFQEISINVSSGSETVRNNGKLTFLNGNLVKKEVNSLDTGFGVDTRISTYEYDNKTNPYKNIQSFTKVLDFGTIISQNNLLRDTSVFSSTSSGSNPSTSVDSNTLEYNDNGYPSKRQTFYNGTLENSSQYFYE